jgi:transcriptional regulator with XRE-family HTH domain
MKKKLTLHEWGALDPRSVAEQAKFLGLSEPQYWRIRQGHRTSVATAKRIEKLTGVSASVLVGLEKI